MKLLLIAIAVMLGLATGRKLSKVKADNVIPDPGWRVKMDYPVEIDSSDLDLISADLDLDLQQNNWVNLDSSENPLSYGWGDKKVPVLYDDDDSDDSDDSDDDDEIEKRYDDDSDDNDDDDDDDEIEKLKEEDGGRLWKRIISGQRANYGEHPYICSLQRESGGRWYHTCGAVIFNANTVLTAAHCVQRSASTLRVRCGDYRLRRRDAFEQTVYLTSILTHPNYSSDGNRGFPNDIAMLQLNTPLTFDAYVSAIAVAGPDTELPIDCVISGWGLTERSDRLPNKLRDVTIRKLTNAECENRWNPSIVNAGHVCFKDRGSYDGACNGDSGGPARCGDYLVGLTSYGISGCISTYYPSVYTRVSYFKDWIVQNAFQ